MTISMRKAVQKRLKRPDGTPIAVDGDWGNETELAIYNFVVPENEREKESIPVIPAAGARADDRSEKKILTLHPSVQPLARALVLNAVANGINIVITSGHRSYEEQNALYAKGGVTKARGGYSNHNFGLAFDVTIFNDKEPVWESPDYKKVGKLGVALGLDWGGNWTSFKDEPHFQLRPDWAKGMRESNMLAELRRRKASGQDFFV